jgi:diacylglycerol kinase family enzyme
LFETLEPRVLLTADPLGLSSPSPLQSPVQEFVVPLSAADIREASSLSADGGPVVTQVVFVDSAVSDGKGLMSGRSPNDCGATRVVYLDASRDGAMQIAETLAEYHDLAAIHILSHGDSGRLLLGDAVVDVQTLGQYGRELKAWGAALAEEGDLLLYGCNVAQGAAGIGFLDRLATLTGADIAASDDPTGGISAHGDWNLESTRGSIQAVSVLNASTAEDYACTLQFTVAVLPDTQKYSEQQLQPFFDQTQWIANNADSENIAFVSHVGDVVENGAQYESEWVFADAAMDILDGTDIPYSVTIGNHDYDIAGTHSTVNRFAGLDAAGNVDPLLVDKSFGPSRYEGESWFLGASDDLLNYCQIFTADGQDYLHINLEWEPRLSSVEWAQQQIDAHPELPVILSTHYFIDPLVDGHFLTTYSDDGLNGEELFQALVYPNPQIFMVLSGHNTEWHEVSTDEAGFQVIEIMTDYQSRVNGGNGWMQLIGFDPDLNRIDVQTYSPTLDQFELDGNSQFSFDFDFDQRFNFLQAPMATLAEPVDQGPNDKDPAYDAVLVNTEQSCFRIQLMDANDDIDDTTVTGQTAVIRKNDVVLTESVDYSFSYDSATDRIAITPIGGSFGDGLYEIALNSGTARIADVGGHELATDLLTVEIDTSIPQTAVFQQGVNGYAGTLDTYVRGSAATSEFSTSPSITVDAENSGKPVHGLLRFDNLFGSGPGQIPAGSQISSAQLELTVTDPGNALKFHRMLRDWVETETWNSLVTGIQANDIEAVSAPDATTPEVAVGKLTIDVTASLIAWANNPSANLGWAILPTAPNGVMFDSSEGTAPPKLTVTFGGTVVDTTPPSGTLIAPLDQGPNDRDPIEDAVVVNTTQPYLCIRLEDQGQGIDDATVTGQTAVIRKNGVVLAESVDYSFSYDAATDLITITPTGGPFGDGLYEITLNDGAAKIADVTGNSLIATTFSIQIDTSIPVPQTAVFQQGANGYAGSLDTYVRGSAATSEFSAATSITVDAENSGKPVHGLLRFDNLFGSGPGQIPAGSQISSAQLELTVTDPGNALKFHRMLRDWVETETWNSLVTGIQANDIEAASIPDATTPEVAMGKLTIDVTASLIAWANNPSANFGWAILPTAPNGVMFDSSEGTAPPKLTVTFTTASANNPPAVALANTVETLPENADTSSRIKVADIVVTDDGSGTNLLSLAGTDAALFEIEGTSLYLKAAAILDYEQNPALDVTVAVDDPAVGTSPDAAAALTIGIADINEPPTVALANTVMTLVENTDTSLRIKVADIVVTDDALGTNLLSLAGTDAGLFEIDANALYLKAATILDPDANPTLDVTVIVDDPAIGTSPEGTAALAIAVTEVNNPPTVALNNPVAALPENADTSSRTKVADIVITDDGSGTNLLSLAGADAALFEIDGTQLYLKAGASLDYETHPTLNVTVAVDDPTVGAAPDSTATLAIAVTNVNEPPTIALENALTTLAEDADTSLRTKVADIAVTDDGTGANALSLAGADADLFEIDGTELYLRAGVVLNYESNPALDAVVSVDDPTVGATPDSSAAITIAITGVNEPPTVTLANTITALAENADTSAPTKVADIVVTDDAVGTNTLSLGGADATLFEIDGTGLYLKVGATLDYETHPVLEVIVAVDDPTVGTSPDATAALTIGVADVNESPVVALANGVTTLPENADTSVRIKVADIVVTDDALGTNTLNLTGTDAGLFEIDGTGLYLKAATVLDADANSMLDVTVAVDDPAIGTTPDGTASLAISVTPVHESQTVVFQQGLNGYTGTLDTDVRGDAPNNQYSTSSSVRADSKNVTYPVHALLQFADIFGSGPGQIPEGVQITSAQLEITVADGGNSLEFHRMLRNWVETETWNTLGAGIQADDIEAVGTADAVTSPVVLGTLSIDVTNSLAAWADNPAARFGWAVLPTGSDCVLFNSSEGAIPPKLTVTYVAAPGNDPPTVALANAVTALPENTDTSVRIKAADIAITDDGSGTNALSLAGTDAELFEISGTELYLKAGAALDHETNPSLDVTVAVDDSTVGTSPDATASLTISITDVPEMITYYVSQSGTGDGSAADASAGIADFNAGTGAFDTLDGATICFLGTITTTIAPADSGTAGSRVVLRGDSPGQPCTIDGAGALAVGIDIADHDYISVIGFAIQNTTTSAISVGSGAADTAIEDCTITQTAGHAIAFASPVTITGNIVTAIDGTESLYSLLGTGGGTVAIANNTFNFNHAAAGLCIRGYGDHAIADNDINLTAGSAMVLYAYGTGGETGSIQFSGNDVDSSVAPNDSLVLLANGNWAVTISDNAFDLTSPTFSHEVIYLNGLAAPAISGNTIAVADDVPCVYLAGNGRDAVATIARNAFTHNGGGGEQYLIRVGGESENPDQYSYDGVVITDNRVTGFDPNGNCHAVFVGFNRNAVIARNTISNAGYGVVVKGTEGTDYTSGGILHNVIYNCDIGIRIKGVDDVVVANNTVYAPHALIVTGNVGGDESTGVILKNNILSGTGGCLLQIGGTTDQSSIDTADYASNCLYTYSYGDYVKRQGVLYTYSEWVALGYDNGSINADPLFTSLATGDLTLQGTSLCIDAGTNLGNSYDDALASSSTWPLLVTTLDQDDYGSGWEIGAYVAS